MAAPCSCLLLVLSATGVAARSTYGSPESLPYKGVMDPDENYQLSWQLDGEDMYFEVEVKTTGWVGLGFSPNGDMPGSDIIIMWVSNGQAHVQDRHAVAQQLPLMDADQDVTLVSGEEKDGVTTVRIKRKLRPCDPQDRHITDDAMRVIWAYGTEDPSNDGWFAQHDHDKRGVRTLYLLEQDQGFKLDDDTYEFDLLNNNVEIPMKGTTYWCTVRAAPKLDSKRHIIGFDVIIPKKKYMVHHISIYACNHPEFREDHWSQQPDYAGHECMSPEMPNDWVDCKDMIYAWTVGGERVLMPDHVGYPLGEADSPTYFLMETHYDNYGGESGVIDNSGLKLLITPTPRPVDMGLLYVGVSVYGWFVPPRAKNFFTEGWCFQDCSKSFIPPEGLTLYAYMLHAHYLAHKIHVTHYRNGTELPPLALEDNYDFNFQVTHLYNEPRKLHAGDEVKVSCDMNSNRDVPVTGGIDSYADEMCQAFIYYYPKQSIGVCTSTPKHGVSNDDPLWSTLRAETKFSKPDVHSDVALNLTESLRDVQWNKDLYDAAQQSFYTSPHQASCQQVGAIDYPLHQKYVTPQPYKARYTSEETCVPSGEKLMSGAVTTHFTLHYLLMVAGAVILAM